MYTYTIIVDGARATRKLVIEQSDRHRCRGKASAPFFVSGHAVQRGTECAGYFADPIHTMKHIFTLAACVLAFQVSAQQVEQLPRKATEQELEVSRLLGLEEVARAEAKGLRGGGDSTIVFFYEDFANGFAGNNGYGALTVEDSSPDVTIWQYVDAAGDGYFQDATESGVQPPAGEFSTNIGALNSETADNGWMIFDCDYYNTPISSGVEDTEGFLNLPTLDMSGLESVVISWDQYLRYCCYPYLPIYVEVSSDGGASWTSFEAGGTFIPSANSASANPLVTGLDISCAAAGEAAVDIRLLTVRTPSWAMATATTTGASTTSASKPTPWPMTSSSCSSPTATCTSSSSTA